MACYRKGGCGPYEAYSCSECPASKSEYANKYINQKAVAADVDMNKRGEWRIETDEEMPLPMFKLVICSNCNETANNTYNYCPNCGAYMKKEKEHYWLQKREEEAYPCIGRNLPFVFYSHYLECPNCGAHEKYDSFNPKFEAPQSCPECGIKLKGIK